MVLNRKKKNLFAVVQFDETVAETVYDRLKADYEDDSKRGAIVKTPDDDYLVVALLEKEIEDAFGGVKKAQKSEEAGTFVANINSNIIDHIVVESDIANGILGIIPTTDTIGELFELSFIDKTPFRVARVPKDFNADDGLIVYDTKLTLDNLKDIKNGYLTIEINGDDASVVDIKKDDKTIAKPIETEPDNYDDVDSDLDEPEFEDVEDVDAFDDAPANDSDELVNDFVEEQVNDESNPFVDVEKTATPHYSAYVEPEEEYQPLETSVNSDTFVPVYESDDQYNSDIDNGEQEVSIDELANVQEQVLNEFDSDDLNIVIDAKVFDDIYGTDSHPIELFNEQVQNPNSSLDAHVAQMASAANTRSLQYVDSNINTLRSEFLLTLRSYAAKLEKTLDYHDPETAPGEKVKKIQDELEEHANLRHEAFEEKAKELRADYEARKKRVVEEAIARAENEFDRENLDELNRKLKYDDAQAQVEINALEADKMRKLHQQRRDVARKAIEQATTKLLLSYRDRVEDVYVKQSDMFNTENEHINEYIKENYDNEIMRANTVRQELDRKRDLQNLEDKYNTNMAEKDAELRRVLEQSAADLDKARKEASFDIDKVRKDLAKQIESERTLNESLRADLSKLTDKYAALDSEKEEEYRHQLAVANDRVNALESKADQRRRDDERVSRNRWIVTIVAIVVSLLVGIGGTFSVTHSINQQSEELSGSKVEKLTSQLEDSKEKLSSYKSKAESQQAQIDALNETLNSLTQSLHKDK